MQDVYVPVFPSLQLNMVFRIVLRNTRMHTKGIHINLHNLISIHVQIRPTYTTAYMSFPPLKYYAVVDYIDFHIKEFNLRVSTHTPDFFIFSCVFITLQIQQKRQKLFTVTHYSTSIYV